ncbi:endospore germination permease [Paenibacillus sp. CGMCC 1.16610]|uniref:Endospore germination permease n=1 Tax=Paenibacillus anseongense TaxID=2682845 RepID=A0ABW9UHF0_9BACL|nr:MULTISPECIES: endospore germination permease [Paenibacillus]MBA2939627.1 endospore germination permease [Paenibacillus sp. CGMCC 1.16610]MVQ39288.1 endospore germination permease [Paenibacillus anseongense]
MAGLEKISHIQFSFLIFGFITGFEGLFLSEAKVLQQDVWIANVVNIFMGIGVLSLICYVQRQFPQKSLAEICNHLMGKWVGKAMLCIYLLNNIENASGGFRALSMFYTTILLPNTNANIMILTCVICSTYGVYIGLGTLVRTNFVVLPFFLIGFLATCLFVFPEIQTNPFLPPFQSKFSEIIVQSLHLFTFTFSELITFGFLMSRVEQPQKLFSSSVVAIIMSGLYMLIITYLTLGSLGLNYVKTSTFPFFSTLQLVKFGEYLERIEVILIGLWTVLTLIYSIVLQYVFTLILGNVFKIKKKKPFVFVVGLLFFAHASRSFIRTSDHFTYGDKIFPISSLLPCIIFPILLAVFAMIRKRSKEPLRGT